ncbi:hypothetical protein ACS3UN_01845 [Oscillospiraceae bacterium LTW-04]|nr:hypothetical protein RBH76_08615 [Oscillospiraceae bacterium MB24-C1]
MGKKYSAKPSTTLILLSGTALLEFILLLENFGAVFSPERNTAFIIEMIFLVAALVGAIFSAFTSDWGGRLGSIAAYGVFTAYALWSLYSFSLFSSKFAECFSPQYGQYYGMAIQAAKLFVLFIGIAAKRTDNLPNTRTYVSALDKVSQRKQLEWAAAAEKSSKKEAIRTVENLKAQLGEVEFARLISQIEESEAEKSETTPE